MSFYLRVNRRYWLIDYNNTGCTLSESQADRLTLTQDEVQVIAKRTLQLEMDGIQPFSGIEIFDLEMIPVEVTA